MRSLYDFIIEPIGNRYNNKKKVGDKELILNTDMSKHLFVNREARVLSIPTLIKTDIKPGDTVVIHHNVFRRWHNIRGKEKNSRSYLGDNKYAVRQDQIFLYKRDNKWTAPNGYSFVQPIKSSDKYSGATEAPCMGILKYHDNSIEGVNVNDLVGFKPDGEYEFIIEGKRLYRLLSKFITVKYEYKGQEEEYNPSWL